MAKKKDGKYLISKRSDLWLKIKARQTVECFILGFTQGKGERKTTFGALQIAERIGEEFHYRGKVGTGFDEAMMKELKKKMDKLKESMTPSLKGGKIVDEKITTWIEPILMAELNYSRLTPDNMLREPVFLRLRPDL